MKRHSLLFFLALLILTTLPAWADIDDGGCQITMLS